MGWGRCFEVDDSAKVHFTDSKLLTALASAYLGKSA